MQEMFFPDGNITCFQYSNRLNSLTRRLPHSTLIIEALYFNPRIRH
jgi:hypothetical protein